MHASSIINIEALTFGWKRDQLTLDIDALSVNAGERVFVQGPSGCGKSTLLNLLGGVIVPRTGRISVLGEDLGRLGQSARDRFRADHVGFIFQQFNLVPYLGVIDNVLLAVHFSAARRSRIAANGMSTVDEARRLLTELGLGDPEQVARPVTELSVGQQQRVAAARALLGAPELVIADEPTSSLDTRHRESFLKLLDLECRRSNATLFFVSHDDTLARGFDRRINLPDINRATTHDLVTAA
jgi:putative ABC transport system ATP-binding protein